MLKWANHYTTAEFLYNITIFFKFQQFGAASQYLPQGQMMQGQMPPMSQGQMPPQGQMVQGQGQMGQGQQTYSTASSQNYNNNG